MLEKFGGFNILKYVSLYFLYQIYKAIMLQKWEIFLGLRGKHKEKQVIYISLIDHYFVIVPGVINNQTNFISMPFSADITTVLGDEKQQRSLYQHTALYCQSNWGWKKCQVCQYVFCYCAFFSVSSPDVIFTNLSLATILRQQFSVIRLPYFHYLRSIS